MSHMICRILSFFKCRQKQNDTRNQGKSEETKKEDEDDYKYEYEDRNEDPNKKVYIFFDYKNFKTNFIY